LHLRFVLQRKLQQQPPIYELYVCAAGLRLNCADANAFFCLAYTKCNYCAVPWLALSQFIAPVCFFHSGAAAAAVGFDFIIHLGRVLT
jgi:hypothetical protein